ncbi:MAG TPA: hypothetical protein VNF47_19910 [Streptosporangiaceae bacterium]|nr:hypothetical protein [Streptosporangiaceae bacterium]
MPDAQAFTTTPEGVILLAELIGLDRWDFMDQIGAGRQAAEVVADQVATVAERLDQLASCRDRLVLLSAFAAAMCPGGVDAAAATHLAAAAASLVPVSRSLAAAPAAQWWWEPPDPHHQRWLCTSGEQLPRGAVLAQALRAQAAADEEEERWSVRELPWPPEDGKPHSGTWWSAPLGNGVFTSTGPVGPLPSVELGCAEDSVGEDRFEVWNVEISPQARIWNITSTDDWGRLAARYPRDVTASRRHDWYQPRFRSMVRRPSLRDGDQTRHSG